MSANFANAQRDGHVLSDLRIGPSAKDGWDWVASVHEGQLQRLAQRSDRNATQG